MPLETVQLELLHRDDHPGAGLDRRKRALVDPPLEHGAEAPLPEQAVSPEVPCGTSQLTEGELAEVGRLQDLLLGPRSRWHRRRRTLAKSAGISRIAAVAALGIVTWIAKQADAVPSLVKLTLT